MAEQESSVATAPDQLCSLPFVGRTTVEDAVFYSVTGAIGVVGLVSWPTVGLFAAVHALHQRARNVHLSGGAGEVRAGLLDAAEEFE